MGNAILTIVLSIVVLIVVLVVSIPLLFVISYVLGVPQLLPVKNILSLLVLFAWWTMAMTVIFAFFFGPIKIHFMHGGRVSLRFFTLRVMLPTMLVIAVFGAAQGRLIPILTGLLVATEAENKQATTVNCAQGSCTTSFPSHIATCCPDGRPYCGPPAGYRSYCSSGSMLF